jgi:hypothetical protein
MHRRLQLVVGSHGMLICPKCPSARLWKSPIVEREPTDLAKYVLVELVIVDDLVPLTLDLLALPKPLDK